MSSVKPQGSNVQLNLGEGAGIEILEVLRYLVTLTALGVL